MKQITYQEYQLGVYRTVQDDVDLTPGLIGEMGELIDLWKKATNHKRVIPREQVIEEAGDVLWYLAGYSLCFDVVIDYLEEDIAPWWPLFMGVHALVTGGDAEGQVMAAVLSLVRELTGDKRPASELFSEIALANLAKLKARYPRGFEPGGGIR